MIALDNLSVRAGRFALEAISLTVATGQYGVLMGRTASGKTTLLETICGLRQAHSGRILVGGRDVTGAKPAARGIGYVPQDAALFTTMTVRENLAFALRVRRWDDASMGRRLDELANMLGIPHLLERTPRALSGGERQRVALGRALAFSPTVLCLDEPLSSLDEDTRQEMCDLLRRVTRATGVTALHITHSSSEARLLGDRLFRLEGGAVREVTP